MERLKKPTPFARNTSDTIVTLPNHHSRGDNLTSLVRATDMAFASSALPDFVHDHSSETGFEAPPALPGPHSAIWHMHTYTTNKID